MQQITSFHQVQELKVGSVLIHGSCEPPARFFVQSCTPIGWEDIELELLPVEDSSGQLAKSSPPGAINMLGSEIVGEPLWWISI